METLKGAILKILFFKKSCFYYLLMLVISVSRVIIIVGYSALQRVFFFKYITW